MALNPIPVSPFPDVPMAPGVPPVLRDTSAVPMPAPTPLVRDDSSVSQSGGGVRWGIFDNAGAQLLTPDSFIAAEYSRDWRLADYPLEKGAFESYNKVTRPYELRVTLTKGGTENDRSDFINAIEALGQSLTLISTVTPEHTYLQGNIAHVNYDRTAHAGASMITATLGIMEIRTTVTAAYSQTKTASAADPVNAGAVQTKPLTASQQAVVDSETSISDIHGG